MQRILVNHIWTLIDPETSERERISAMVERGKMAAFGYFDTSRRRYVEVRTPQPLQPATVPVDVPMIERARRRTLAPVYASPADELTAGLMAAIASGNQDTAYQAARMLVRGPRTVGVSPVAERLDTARRGLLVRELRRLAARGRCSSSILRHVSNLWRYRYSRSHGWREA